MPIPSNSRHSQAKFTSINVKLTSLFYGMAERGGQMALGNEGRLLAAPLTASMLPASYRTTDRTQCAHNVPAKGSACRARHATKTVSAVGSPLRVFALLQKPVQRPQ